jgi:predicted AAA+ superfamily ATPase
MESIIERHFQRLSYINTDFIRSLAYQIDWDSRLIGIKGARGVGKTTLLLQYIKQHYGNSPEALYVSLDNIWFSEHKLSSLVDLFTKRGGKYLFLDEVHKYPSWSQEIKNIYDDYPQLQVVFTGSSLLEILNARADLSRRAIVYKMQGLSFREYLDMYYNISLPVISLDEIINNHPEITSNVLAKTKPLKYFPDYLKIGYYPFYKESSMQYYPKLEEIIHLILEIELPLLRNIEIAYIRKIKQLLQIIASAAPFIPNIHKLSERIGITRNTLISYLYYLDEVRLIHSLYKDANGISRLQKPDKLFLENTNMAYALASGNTSIGNMRETFFVNQLNHSHQVEYAPQGDFLIDGKYTFEVGGKKKTDKQIKEVQHAFVVSDDIEYGTGNKIPLWLFGLLY